MSATEKYSRESVSRLCEKWQASPYSNLVTTYIAATWTICQINYAQFSIIWGKFS